MKVMYSYTTSRRESVQACHYSLITVGFAFSGSLLTYRLGSRGFGAGRVSKTDIWINCNSFCFICTFGKRKYKS